MARTPIKGVIRAKSGRISRSRASLAQRGLLAYDEFVVYFAKTEDQVKIGFTGSAGSRMETLAYETGKVPRIVGVAHLPSENAARKLERKMHEIFASKRIKGEWFDLTLSDVLGALDMCRKIGIRTSGGMDARGDIGLMSCVKYATDHSTA